MAQTSSQGKEKSQVNMARPKEKVSAAFQQKCQAAADKLLKFQAEKLRSDMERLFTEQTLADLTVELLNCSISLHSCVLKARTKDLYEFLISLSGGCRGDDNISLVKYGKPSELSEIFKALYIEDDINPWLRKLETIFEEAHVTKSEKIIDDNKTSEDEIKQSANNRKTVLNGIHNTECGDDNLHEIAEKIVQTSIKEAKAIFEREKENNANVNNDIVNLDSIDGENIEEVSENVNSEKFNGCLNSESKSNSETGRENTAKTVSFRRTKDENKGILWDHAKKTLGTNLVFESCSDLAEDLLRMLVKKESCDYDVVVLGKKIRVHSCILAARSSYFEAMLAGCWRESDADQIVLEGVEPSVVPQMLLYLYGGVIEVDPACTLGGLVMMSDMYSMEGLKEVVAFNLNKEYCHFFHRPCSGCIAGVPDTLALTMMYNMATLKEKCVRWINKNFDKVWPTKTFAQLPQEVLQFCVSSAVKDLALDNVIDIMVECRKLNETTPRLRWSEPIFDMITQLMDAAIEYGSQNFVPLVSSKNFRQLNEGIAFNRQPLEDIFGMVITALSPENACQSYLSLNKWVAMAKPKEGEEKQEISLYSQEFCEFVEYLFKKCKDHLCMYIQQAANTVEWGLLTKDMQQDLMTEANYVVIDHPNRNRVARPKLTSMQKKISTTSPLSLKEYFDRHFISKEHIQPSARGPGSSAKPQPTGSKGRSPTPSTGASSKLRKKEPEKSKVQDTSKTSKQTQQTALDRNTGAKTRATKIKPSHATETKVQSKSGVQKESSSVKHDQKNPRVSPRPTGPQRKSLLPRPKTPNSGTEKGAVVGSGEPQEMSDSRDIEDDDDDELSDEPEIEPRARSNSASAVAFVPSFGQPALVRSAQSMDSFFDSREGHNCSIQKPLPVFEVKFIVPHEFFESF